MFKPNTPPPFVYGKLVEILLQKDLNTNQKPSLLIFFPMRQFRIELQTLFTLFLSIKSRIFDKEIIIFLFCVTKKTVNKNAIIVKMCENVLFKPKTILIDVNFRL